MRTTKAAAKKLARADQTKMQSKPWMTLAGGLKHLHAENRRIDRMIEAEFEIIESGIETANHFRNSLKLDAKPAEIDAFKKAGRDHHSSVSAVPC